jgi:hypothetical protein
MSGNIYLAEDDVPFEYRLLLLLQSQVTKFSSFSWWYNCVILFSALTRSSHLTQNFHPFILFSLYWKKCLHILQLNQDLFHDFYSLLTGDKFVMRSVLVHTVQAKHIDTSKSSTTHTCTHTTFVIVAHWFTDSKKLNFIVIYFILFWVVGGKGMAVSSVLLLLQSYLL